MKIVFFGTSEFAAVSLRKLATTTAAQIASVVTQPDQPRGRKLRLQASPVKLAAQELGLDVMQPKRARDLDFVEQMRTLSADMGIVASYGQILSRDLLEAPRLGCLNVHASLLPRHRGAAPIQRAIMEGDEETGITIMQMDEGLDTGPMLSAQATAIDPLETAGELHDRLADLGAQLLIETLPGVLNGTLSPTPQPEQGASYASKIEKKEGEIDWRESAPIIHNRIRALSPAPGAFTTLPAIYGELRLKLFDTRTTAENTLLPPGSITHLDKNKAVIACGEGCLELSSLQLQGKPRMALHDFLNGAKSMRTGLRFI